MLTDEKEILIDKYFRQELNQSEEEQFNRHMADDPEFKEAVENQSILLEGLEILELENQVKRYLEEASDAPVIPLWRRRSVVGIAASFLVLVMLTSYAGYKLGWFKGLFGKEELIEKPQENVVPADTLQESTVIPSFYDQVQTTQINTAYTMEVEGGLGTKFRFPAGSLLDENEQVIIGNVNIEIIELLNSEHINPMTADASFRNQKVLKLFYMLPYHAEGSISFNPLMPPKLILPEGQEVKLYYGGDNRNEVKWSAPQQLNGSFIEKPTQAMEDYRRFIEGQLFIDSLNRHYVKKGQEFVPAEGKGMSFSEEFVQEIEQFVNRYGRDANFRKKVITAQNEWRIYEQQHNLKIGRAKDALKNSIPLYQPGWYAVVKK